MVCYDIILYGENISQIGFIVMCVNTHGNIYFINILPEGPTERVLLVA